MNKIKGTLKGVLTFV